MKVDPPRRTPRLALTVQYAVAARNLPARTQIRRWVRAALEHDARITVRVVGRAEGKALNRHFRGRDYPTNVLTFVYRDASPYDGDLALCAPVVTHEAHAQRKSVAAHYAQLVVHGTLHLQGYDHIKAADAAVMEARESQIIVKLGYPDPYSVAERATARGKALRAA
ncbi:MAG: rRNA maturation RNase YbeY [Burkholderiales bacterium]|nr:rRNA maturation RNase YbeY [Burkholderiales bacterium]